MDGKKSQFGVVFIALCLSLFASCSTFGQRTHGEAIVPAAQGIWAHVSADVERGIATAQATGEIRTEEAQELRSRVGVVTEALASGSAFRIAASPWESLKPWAARGVVAQLEAGEITPGVAGSLMERIELFDELMAEASGLTKVRARSMRRWQCAGSLESVVIADGVS